MVDKHKVLKGLECCILRNPDDHARCSECPYEGNCVNRLKMDTLELLKEQEAKPMTEYDDGWDCPRCGLKLVGKTASGYPCDEFDLPNDEIVKYCPVCGQAVKWE